MHVVADASPLRYLILIGYIDLLPTLFTQISSHVLCRVSSSARKRLPWCDTGCNTLPVWCVVRTPQQPLATGLEVLGAGNVRPWRSLKSCTLTWWSSTKIKDAR